MSDVLEVTRLSAARGTKTVLHEVSIRLEAGKTVAMLGPNGAGKSSLVLAMAGVLPISGGTVTLGGRHLEGLAPDAVRQAGIAAVPEGHQVLTALSVEENLQVAVLPRDQGRIGEAVERAYGIFPELREIRDRQAGALSGGQQQMLALAQGLTARPAFLLADEMSLGLAPVDRRAADEGGRADCRGGDRRPPHRAVHPCCAAACRLRLCHQPRAHPLRGDAGGAQGQARPPARGLPRDGRLT